MESRNGQYGAGAATTSYYVVSILKVTLSFKMVIDLQPSESEFEVSRRGMVGRAKQTSPN